MNLNFIFNNFLVHSTGLRLVSFILKSNFYKNKLSKKKNFYKNKNNLI